MAAWAEESQLESLEQMAGVIDRLARRIEDAAEGAGQEGQL